MNQPTARYSDGGLMVFDKLSMRWVRLLPPALLLVVASIHFFKNDRMPRFVASIRVAVITTSPGSQTHLGNSVEFNVFLDRHVR